MVQGTPIGTGKEAEVFAWSEGKVLKLYRSPASKASAFREAANLSLVERLALPAPRGALCRRLRRQMGLVTERAEGPAFALALDDGRWNEHLLAMVALEIELHAKSGAGLLNLKAGVTAKLGRAPVLSADQRRRLLSRLAALPDGDRLCHGDFHPWNILGSPSSALVIDWLDATQGSPAADACRSFLLLSRAAASTAQPYLNAYLSQSGLAPEDVTSWLPVLAGARLSEDVPGETDALMALVEAG